MTAHVIAIISRTRGELLHIFKISTWGVVDRDNASDVEFRKAIHSLSMRPLSQIQLPWQHL